MMPRLRQGTLSTKCRAWDLAGGISQPQVSLAFWKQVALPCTELRLLGPPGSPPLFLPSLVLILGSCGYTDPQSLSNCSIYSL